MAQRVAIFSEIGMVAMLGSAGLNVVEPLAWVAGGVLLLFVLILATGDLFMKFESCKKAGKAAHFEWEAEILNRAFVLFLVPISLMADAMVYFATRLLPDQFVFLDKGWLFFTLTTLVWLNTAYSFRILDHIRKRAGIEYVPPTLGLLTRHIQGVLRAIRMVDQKRYNETGHEGDLPERWTDKLTEEQLIELADKLRGKGMEAAPAILEETLSPPPPTKTPDDEEAVG